MDAESKGGHLATITSQEEWDGLRQNYGTSLVVAGLVLQMKLRKANGDG